MWLIKEQGIHWTHLAIIALELKTVEYYLQLLKPEILDGKT